MRRKVRDAFITAAGISIAVAIVLGLAVAISIATYPRPTGAQEPCAVPPPEQINARIINQGEYATVR